MGESQFKANIERALELVASQARPLKAALERRIGPKSSARRKDAVLAGGMRCMLDQQVRRRQLRKDTAAQAAWTQGQHTDPGIRREDLVRASQASKERKERDSILECLLAC